MSSFRQYGGLNRAPTNNIVRNHYSNSDNPTISNFLGLYNSKIVSESHLDLSGNSILNINGIYFDNGTTIIDGSFNGDLTVNGNLEVTKNTKLDGSLNVFGDVSLNSTLEVGGVATFDASMVVYGDVSLNSTLEVVGVATFDASMVVYGDVSLNSTLEVGGVATFDASMVVYGDVSLNSTLEVAGDVLFDNNLNVAGTTTSLYFVSGSDYRIKTDVKPLDHHFAIDQLNPVTYTNKVSGNQDTGFIAHEVQEIFPHLVTGKKDGKETQTLNYQGLIAILTREIQELKKRVEILENK
jgi:predicted acyltransferase (DUF342 family)